jgi:hypothetical protein
MLRFVGFAKLKEFGLVQKGFKHILSATGDPWLGILHCVKGLVAG